MQCYELLQSTISFLAVAVTPHQVGAGTSMIQKLHAHKLKTHFATRHITLSEGRACLASLAECNCFSPSQKQELHVAIAASCTAGDTEPVSPVLVPSMCKVEQVCQRFHDYMSEPLWDDILDKDMTPRHKLFKLSEHAVVVMGMHYATEKMKETIVQLLIAAAYPSATAKDGEEFLKIYKEYHIKHRAANRESRIHLKDYPLDPNVFVTDFPGRYLEPFGPVKSKVSDAQLYEATFVTSCRVSNKKLKLSDDGIVARHVPSSSTQPEPPPMQGMDPTQCMPMMMMHMMNQQAGGSDSPMMSMMQRMMGMSGQRQEPVLHLTQKDVRLQRCQSFANLPDLPAPGKCEPQTKPEGQLAPQTLSLIHI